MDEYMLSNVEQAKQWILNQEIAVEGNSGESITINVARSLINGFDLSPEEAFDVAQSWNQKCQPPWTDRDLLRKMEEAAHKMSYDREAGYMLKRKRKRKNTHQNTAQTTIQKTPPAKPKQEYNVTKTGYSPSAGFNAFYGTSSTGPREEIFRKTFQKWIEHKKGISITAIEKTKAAAGTYKGKESILFRIYSPINPKTQCGDAVYHVDGKNVDTKNGSEKVKILANSLSGIVGVHAANALAERNHKKIIKAAGISDYLSIFSQLIEANLLNEYLAFTNSSGETENTDKYDSLLKPILKDADYYIIADNDETGEKAAIKWAKHGLECKAKARVVFLPEEINGVKIKDVRDYFINGKSFADLLKLFESATIITEENLSDFQNEKVKNKNEKEPDNVFSPNRTKPIADAFIEKFYTIDGVPAIKFQNDNFYVWKNNAYRPIETKEIQSKMLHFLDGCVTEKKFGKETIYDQFPAKDSTVNSAVSAVTNVAFRNNCEKIPGWLGDSEPPVEDTSMIVFGKTRNLDIKTMKTFEASPKWFNYNALDFDYDENDPKCCPEWNHFLKQIFKEDSESVPMLMQFIGLLLTPITKFQKALLIVGPKRSGKGTIGRVIRKLVGDLNCCSPTTDGLTGQFGLQSLIGKTVAIVSDARFSGQNQSILIERILNITGEDAITIDRKYQTAANLRLPTRFIFLSNEVPRLADASGALASRFLILKLTESFYQREDLELEQKLLKELPGILHTALEYLKELLEKGYFVQPKSAQNEVELLEDLGSPIGKFVREHCKIDNELLWTSSDDLWKAWKNYCQEEGIHSPGHKVYFFRNLNSFVSGLRRTQRKEELSGKKFWAYEGIQVIETNPF